MKNASETQSTVEFFKQSRRFILQGGVAILIALLVVTAFFIRSSSESVILRYNVFLGIDILGTWWQAYLVPGMCSVFFLGNLVVAEILARRHACLSALVLLYGAAIVVLSGAVATATIIFINS